LQKRLLQFTALAENITFNHGQNLP